jgi:hypothetical protein
MLSIWKINKIFAEVFVPHPRTEFSALHFSPAWEFGTMFWHVKFTIYLCIQLLVTEKCAAQTLLNSSFPAIGEVHHRTGISGFLQIDPSLLDKQNSPVDRFFCELFVCDSTDSGWLISFEKGRFMHTLGLWNLSLSLMLIIPHDAWDIAFESTLRFWANQANRRNYFSTRVDFFIFWLTWFCRPEERNAVRVLNH